ncbi:MAG: hypothetical protein ACJAVF_000193 [Paraglaciecola sp.]|jgi:hypothetical protein
MLYLLAKKWSRKGIIRFGEFYKWKGFVLDGAKPFFI